MTEPLLNFARRPFRDERPVYFAAAVGLLAATVLLFVNVRLYVDFQRQIGGTSAQIDYLEQRQARAAREADAALAALNNYKVSSLARESQGLLRLVGERRFSWTGLLARLERVLPPDVRVARMTPTIDRAGEAYLSLGLVGANAESVVRTIAVLSRDAAFDRVELRSESTPEQGVPEGHSFEVSLHYRDGVGREGARREGTER